jgi:hypothetical protein
MNVEAKSLKQSNGFIKTSHLIIFTFATAFFSRLLESAGAPPVVNFVHFATVPFVFGIALFTNRTRDSNQILISKELLLGLLILLTACFASAVWNGAGAINVIFGFLLLAEPFMFLMAIVSIPLSPASLKQFQFWMLGFVCLHLVLVYAQYALGFCNMHGDCDNIQGVFYRSGSGHVVGASISASFAAYYFIAAKNRPLWLRLLVFAIGMANIQLADSKQVIIMFVLAFVIFSLINLKHFQKALLYFIGTFIFIAGFTWAVQNIEALSSYSAWVRPEMYGPEGEATLMKFSGIRIILSHFNSPFNWLFGLGPGHTIGRMGGWMIRDYAYLLKPLGATSTAEDQIIPISELVWNYVASSWLAQGSSFFAPFWGWAGIWGDFGFLGLGAYLYLCSIVWRRLCLENISKFLMLTVFICGFIFTQMEEPGYMLYIATLIGLRWQEIKVDRNSETKTRSRGFLLKNISTSKQLQDYSRRN